MEQDINNLIEELTNVRPNELSAEGLKLFNKINEIIDINKELEEKNKKKSIEIICYQEELENSIPVSLVEEKRTKLKEQYNKVVNEINNQGMIDQLIDFKEVSAKLEMCEELLEKR
ncbi:MAG: hypothetical protein ACI4VH_07965 [Clostridia bacterium]